MALGWNAVQRWARAGSFGALQPGPVQRTAAAELLLITQGYAVTVDCNAEAHAGALALQAHWPAGTLSDAIDGGDPNFQT